GLDTEAAALAHHPRERRERADVAYLIEAEMERRLDPAAGGAVRHHDGSTPDRIHEGQYEGPGVAVLLPDQIDSAALSQILVDVELLSPRPECLLHGGG